MRHAVARGTSAQRDETPGGEAGESEWGGTAQGMCLESPVFESEGQLLQSASLDILPGMNAGDSYRAHAAGAVRDASMGSCFMEGSYSTIVLITKDLGQ